jgi:hypothetical protein
LNFAGRPYYIPREALENLGWYTTFWGDMEKLEKVIKIDEGNTQSNVQINQDQNFDTSLPNDGTKTFKIKGKRSCSHCETKDTTQ